MAVALAALEVAATTLALVLFVQSLWTVGWLAASRQPLAPPVPPPAVHGKELASPTSQGTLSISEMGAMSETQLAIAKAIHPHLHEPAQHAAADGGATCGRLQSLCGSRAYRRVVPYCSVWLAAAQAALGVSVALVALVWQLAGFTSCRALSTAVMLGFHVGLALLLLGSAVQTHLANDKCIKIFFIMCAGLAAHFTMFGLAVGRGGIVSADQAVCVIAVTRDEWLGRLPMYAGIAHFAMCFFSLISFINGAVRLCAHVSFLVPHEILCVFLIFRGVGLLFAAALAGALFSVLVVALAAFGHFRFTPCWLAMWAVVARIMAAALWHRAHTDGAAHTHHFWSSPVFHALCGSRQALPYTAGAMSDESIGWPRRPRTPSLAQIILAIRNPQLSPSPPPPSPKSAQFAPRCAAPPTHRAAHEEEAAEGAPDGGPHAHNRMSRHDTVVERSPRLSHN
ncbi:hypothetical protein H4R18_002414 [Coemansia javaensis]|uniref:Uncharacterized protein n=1 Tax=Coemansia javaensis TaxID=2761396 RepID=A0A9W8HHP0_9FUNG|nr:hypothetical protein H4R18_002414 [Coemansia javaensis]